MLMELLQLIQHQHQQTISFIYGSCRWRRWSGAGGGGGGAGGFREGKDSSDPYTASPFSSMCSSLLVQAYPITVGGGGAGSC